MLAATSANDPDATRRSFRGAGFYISNHTNTRTKRPYIMMAVRKANAARKARQVMGMEVPDSSVMKTGKKN